MRRGATCASAIHGFRVDRLFFLKNLRIGRRKLEPPRFPQPGIPYQRGRDRLVSLATAMRPLGQLRLLHGNPELVVEPVEVIKHRMDADALADDLAFPVPDLLNPADALALDARVDHVAQEVLSRDALGVLCRKRAEIALLSCLASVYDRPNHKAVFPSARLRTRPKTPPRGRLSPCLDRLVA